MPALRPTKSRHWDTDCHSGVVGWKTDWHCGGDAGRVPPRTLLAERRDVAGRDRRRLCGGDRVYRRAFLLHGDVPFGNLLDQTRMGALFSFTAALVAAAAALALRVGRIGR